MSGRWQSEFADSVHGYVDDVQAGRVAVGLLERLAVERYTRDLRRAGRKDFPFILDEHKAARAIRFYQALKHSTGEFDGRPFILQDWQRWVVWNLFGWVHRDTGFRRFREAFLSMGRGNGKSPFVAATLLKLLAADQPAEPRAEIKIAATQAGRDDGSGAKIVFDECARMIERSPALQARCEVLSKAIVYKPTAGTIMALSSKGSTKDGFNLHAYVGDELHEWGDPQAELLEKLETAMGKRRQPLGLLITTAGTDRSTLWLAKHRECDQVLRQVYRDDALFAFICEIDDDDDPLDPANWRKGNPNLGVSVKADYLERLATKARHDRAKRTAFQRYHANKLVRSRDKLIDLDAWNRCRCKLPDLRRRPCHGGLDLGWRDDLAAFYLCFPLDGGRYAFRGWCWCPEDVEHRDLGREPWANWIDQGLLRVTSGDVTDIDAVFRQIKLARRHYGLRTVALDPNNARAVEVRLVNELGLDVYAFGQSCRKYNEPLRELLGLVTNGNLLHDDPLLTWAADNAVGRTDSAGLMMPDKKHSAEKIDPFVAALMAYSECLYAARAKAGGDYNTRGLRKVRPSEA